MAMKKTSEMPVSRLEKPIEVPIISEEITSSGNNTEVFGDNPGMDTPFTDPSLDDEFSMMQSMKDAQLNLDESPAMRHLTGTKTSIIYFNQVRPKVNDDMSNITSPSDVNGTKYNRIDNMILNTDSELSTSFEFEEGVPNNEITATGLLYPGFQPFPGDLFYVGERTGVNVLYIIQEVEPIGAFENTAFKVTFKKHYDQFNPEQMTNLIEGYYVFNFEAVGTGERTIVKKTIYDVYRKVKEMSAAISKEYLDRFYDMNKNVIRWHRKIEKDSHDYLNLSNIEMLNMVDEESPVRYNDIFDPYIMKFLANDEMKDSLVYKGYSVSPITPAWMGEDFDEKYKKTIYYAIQHRKPKLITSRYFRVKEFVSKSLRDLTYRDWFYIEMSQKDVDIIKAYPEKLIENIITNSRYTLEHDSADLMKYNIIIDFINNKKFVPTVEDLEKFIDEIEIIPDDELFGTGPLLLYMCTFFENLILRKTY